MFDIIHIHILSFRFNNLSPPKSQKSYSDQVEQIISIDHNIKNIGDERESQTDRTQHVSTAFDLLTPDFKSTFITDELGQASEQQISQHNGTDDSIDTEIGSDQMFDVDLMFKCVDGNNSDGNKLHADVSHAADIQQEAGEHSKSSHGIPKDTIKRKNFINIEGSEEKRNKIDDNENDKQTYRKEKYTTTVRNWLKEVRPLRAEEQGRVGGEGEQKLAQRKKTRGMVQSRLQNKGGVMRYGRQDGREEHTHVEEQGTADRLNKSAGKVTREKKSKKKFVAPIKSQVPVKDIKYPLKIFEDASCKEIEDADIVNKEIFITLIFR